MKKGRMVSKSVICPFYTEEDRQTIFCEGLEPGTSVHLAFSTPPLLKTYKKRFCECTRYKKCLIAQMLFKKYEEDSIDG